MANGKRKQKRKKNEFVHQCTRKAQAIMAEKMKKIEQQKLKLKERQQVLSNR
jgi:hypothetical protein